MGQGEIGEFFKGEGVLAILKKDGKYIHVYNFKKDYFIERLDRDGSDRTYEIVAGYFDVNTYSIRVGKSAVERLNAGQEVNLKDLLE